ncbi:hypothetical protein KJS94_11430 [Flavihumibacter rivuli]|uniref:hypothetical protein n=1 Tax=Flavihumibacter rivuli TaxID=2838156 RepID=UPI001BDF3D9A|nr:hypothetical protein [Flavihumibacter rivuli]ULQ55253.1 hypothetical protein KJS94_11430 [Flavihumibacter rivuli]
MKQRHFFCCLTIGLLMMACSKQSNEMIRQGEGRIKTEKGMAMGLANHATIGPAGGVLSSTDGQLTVTVPQGAIAANTDFVVQPITNTLYEGKENRLAYRLLPEGVSFDKPVTLTFAYNEDDLNTVSEDLLTVAWQQQDGSWKVEPTRLNKLSKTLTVETTHFSDWTKTGGLELKVEKELLKPGEKSRLSIVSAGDDDLLAYLGVSLEDDARLTALGNWKIVEGRGSIQENKSGSKSFAYTALYTAPSTVPAPMNVTITVAAEGFNAIKDPSAPGGVRNTGKMILFGRLIVSENYMTGTLDGVPFGFLGDKVSAIGMGGAIVVRGSDGSDEMTLTVNATSAGSFPCGQIILPGKAGIIIGSLTGSGPNYGHSYFKCDQTGEVEYSPANLQITKWPEVGGTAEGSFSGPIYLNDGLCGPRQKALTVKFMVTRSN